MKNALILGFIALVLISACEQGTNIGEEAEGITPEQCQEAGGSWNECGSPCAGTDAEMCIQVCQAQCECNGKEFSCPEGYKCRLTGKISDEMGVCVRE